MDLNPVKWAPGSVGLAPPGRFLKTSASTILGGGCNPANLQLVYEGKEAKKAGAQGGMCSFPRAATTKYCKPSGLKQQKFISPFWRLQIQNQGVDRTIFPPEPQGEDLSLPLPVSGRPSCSLACGSITPISASVFAWLLPCVSVALCLHVASLCGCVCAQISLFL